MNTITEKDQSEQKEKLQWSNGNDPEIFYLLKHSFPFVAEYLLSIILLEVKGIEHSAVSNFESSSILIDAPDKYNSGVCKFFARLRSSQCRASRTVRGVHICNGAEMIGKFRLLKFVYDEILGFVSLSHPVYRMALWVSVCVYRR